GRSNPCARVHVLNGPERPPAGCKIGELLAAPTRDFHTGSVGESAPREVVPDHARAGPCTGRSRWWRPSSRHLVVARADLATGVRTWRPDEFGSTEPLCLPGGSPRRCAVGH